MQRDWRRQQNRVRRSADLQPCDQQLGGDTESVGIDMYAGSVVKIGCDARATECTANQHQHSSLTRTHVQGGHAALIRSSAMSCSPSTPDACCGCTARPSGVEATVAPDPRGAGQLGSRQEADGEDDDGVRAGAIGHREFQLHRR